MVKQPPVGQDLILQASPSHSHHTRYDASGRVISPTQIPLPDKHTTLTTEKQPCPRCESNPQSLQARSRTPTFETARPPESAITLSKQNYFFICALLTNYAAQSGNSGPTFRDLSVPSSTRKKSRKSFLGHLDPLVTS